MELSQHQAHLLKRLMTKISDLVGRGVFKFEQYNEKLHSRIRIFKSRLVREVKGKTTKPYEKSRLVIQGYQDHGKEAILTQSPTIQRCSQRLIMSLAPALMQSGMSVKLRIAGIPTGSNSTEEDNTRTPPC
ncbi:hypothetical protein P3342_001656 [Pyrenophora teres f. teres]|nr:hypothetical protein P3342_001656 [Pyrenophora teres f. teres]